MTRFILFIAAIILLCGCQKGQAQVNEHVEYYKGAIVRGDTTEKTIYLVFTGHEFADGGPLIINTLKRQGINASFFFTGDFYRNVEFKPYISDLIADGHYLGAHSDKHLLYCDWDKRDSLLLTKQEFNQDLVDNYKEMERFGVSTSQSLFYLPPYEWYNDSISVWTKELGLQLINYSPGTISHADYTTPEMKNYKNNTEILSSILSYEKTSKNGMNGFILLIHFGVDPDRTEKFYTRLHDVINSLRTAGYQFRTVDALSNK